MGTGSFPGVKSGRGVTLPLTPFYGHERVELYLYSPYGPYGPYRASVPIQGCTYPGILVYSSTKLPEKCILRTDREISGDIWCRSISKYI
jgi:hypothetical protein